MLQIMKEEEQRVYDMYDNFVQQEKIGQSFCSIKVL